jgi:hypothetical protein
VCLDESIRVPLVKQSCYSSSSPIQHLCKADGFDLVNLTPGAVTNVLKSRDVGVMCLYPSFSFVQYRGVCRMLLLLMQVCTSDQKSRIEGCQKLCIAFKNIPGLPEVPTIKVDALSLLDVVVQFVVYFEMFIDAKWLILET